MATSATVAHPIVHIPNRPRVVSHTNVAEIDCNSVAAAAALAKVQRVLGVLRIQKCIDVVSLSALLATITVEHLVLKSTLYTSGTDNDDDDDMDDDVVDDQHMSHELKVYQQLQSKPGASSILLSLEQRPCKKHLDNACCTVS